MAIYEIIFGIIMVAFNENLRENDLVLPVCLTGWSAEATNECVERPTEEESAAAAAAAANIDVVIWFSFVQLFNV